MRQETRQPGLLKASVYGANDGIITTFAVVAGVAGAGLAPKIVLILGIGNLIADGFSMGVGDYVGERSEALAAQHAGRRRVDRRLWLTGLVTFISFVIAGTLPLLPYLVTLWSEPWPAAQQFQVSVAATMSALFLVGSLRTTVTGGRWWRNGLEVLSIGAIAAAVAFGLGAWVESLT